MGSEGTLPGNQNSVNCKYFLEAVNKGVFVSVIKKPLKLGHSAQKKPVKDDRTSSELHRELNLIIALCIGYIIYTFLVLYSEQWVHS